MISLIKKKIQENSNLLFGNELDDKLLIFQNTKKDFIGDTTILVFPLAKWSNKNPISLAEEIGVFLKSNVDEINSFNVVQGFLNIEFSDKYWLSCLKTIDSEENYAFSKEKKSLLMVEFASPNTNKPLHLGHLRNIYLGNSISKILQANGHEVIKTQIINDRGIHICKSMLAWKKFSPINSKGERETPENTNIKGDKLVGKYYVEFDKHWNKQTNEILNKWDSNNFENTKKSTIDEYNNFKTLKLGKDEKTQNELDIKIKDLAKNNAAILLEAKEMLIKWENKDNEVYSLWSMMNNWVYEGFEETYKKLNIQFDKNYYESETYLVGKNAIELGIKKHIFYKKDDNSIWINLESDGLDEKLLIRSDGTSVYMTQDIGTAYQRFLDFPKLSGIVYTVGNEQDYHFKVLFLILKKLGFDWAKHCYHLSYGMVDLPTGKMKSREGTVVDADDLLDELYTNVKKSSESRDQLDDFSDEEKDKLYRTISNGALAYYLLKVDSKKRIMFNPEESIELNGNTGPFIQYTYARINSILSKVKTLDNTFSLNIKLDIEKDLIKKINQYPQIIIESANNFSPYILCQYLFELSKDFNHFYQNVNILKEVDENKKNFLLILCRNVSKIIKSGMNLLSIEVPNRM